MPTPSETRMDTEDQVLFDYCCEQHAVCRKQIAKLLRDYGRARANQREGSADMAYPVLVRDLTRCLRVPVLPGTLGIDVSTAYGAGHYSYWLEWRLTAEDCVPVAIAIPNFGRVSVVDEVVGASISTGPGLSL